MIFWYWPLPTIAPDTGEQLLILRPMVSFSVHGDRRSGTFVGLVDTGADNTILPLSIADRLDIEVQPCIGPSPVAFGGEQLEMSFADVELELTDDDGESYRWTPRVLFYDFPPDQEESAILGHLGFLDSFMATFDSEQGALELVPNQLLPVD